MATPFTPADGSSLTAVANSLLAPNSGLLVAPGSISLVASAPAAVQFYDGSLTSLGIGGGLLLTSGMAPGLTNSVGWFGSDNSAVSGVQNGSAAIDAVVNTVFQTTSYDATMLSFDFTVTDPTATSISFDVVFGSDEYPEWVDLFVDCAVVIVNGVNYALFNNDPKSPLSVVSGNLAAGYFQDNSGNVLPIEYDGVSRVLKIVAPINPGQVNNIKIGIADTGDHIYDSGIFIANMKAGVTPGAGVVAGPDTPLTDNDDRVTGTIRDELFELKGGNDTAYGGGGNDIIVGGTGNDQLFGGSGNDVLEGGAGDDLLDGWDGEDTIVYAGNRAAYAVVYDGASDSYRLTHAGGDGTDTLRAVEFIKFADGTYMLAPEGLTPLAPPEPTPSNKPGNIVITGLGAADNTLQAIVTDVNGLPQAASISYIWEKSSDGFTWSVIGANSASYTVVQADVGAAIRVRASYTDLAQNAEQVQSPDKKIYQVAGGDLIVTLMHLDAPLGASVKTPLTTLLKNAVNLGLSPNVAMQTILKAFGLPADINLLKYDAYALLVQNPNNAQALAVEKVAVQIAILTSLADDDTGMNLTLKAIEAVTANPNQPLDLANLLTIASITGLPETSPTVLEIYDRNKSMASALIDGGNVTAIELQWQDLLGIQDNIASTSIADLSIRINQAPVMTQPVKLPSGVIGASYQLTADSLLNGIVDPEGKTLSIEFIFADKGGDVIQNSATSWTFVPNAEFSGPVELFYSVVDPDGGFLGASTLLVIAPPSGANTAPNITSNGAGGTAAIAVPENQSAATTVTATDPDPNTALTYLISGGADAALFGINATTGALSFLAAPDFETPTDADGNNIYLVDVQVSDGTLTDTQSLSVTVSNVNEQPVLASMVADVESTQGQALSIAVAPDTFTDPDGDTLTYSATLGDGTALPGWLVFNAATQSFSGTPPQNFVGNLDLKVTASDGSLSVSDTFTLSILPTLQSVSGTSGADTLSGIAGSVSAITGGGGNDIITGGSRADIAVYTGNRADYTITTVAGVTTVVDNRAGSPDGTDTLRGLNILRFADRQLFQTAAANKVTLAGQAQTYNVSNSEVVQGTNAAEKFVISPRTSAFVFVGANDVVDLSGAIDSYSYTRTGTELRISDGSYTTTLNFSGTFTLRTASGSTLVTFDASGFKLGGTQTVGTPTFNPLAAITDPNNVSSAVTPGFLQSVSGTSGADTLSGIAGSVSAITGGGGNDIITGGSRADIAVYTGNRADYTITTVAGVTTVVDNRAGSPDGTDTLRGLNILRFADRQLFQTAAANKVTLAGQAQTYNVSNSEVVQGTNAAEKFVISPRTSAFVFVGANDVVDLSGAIDSYSYTRTGTELRISDGSYTTTLNFSGTFTLRTASGSTLVTFDASGFKLGGTQTVGTPTFNPLAAITDTANVSDNADFSTVLVTGGNAYYARASAADIFIVDASQALSATIIGFEEGDRIVFKNRTAAQGALFDPGASNDGIATVTAGTATLQLTGLASDAFTTEASFETIYGIDAIGYLI